MRLPTAALLPMLLLLTACTPGQEPPPNGDPLTGCFATGPRKAADFRIERVGAQYQLSLRRDGQWQVDSEPLRRGTPSEVARYFPDDVGNIQASLLGHGGAFGLFQLQQGAALKGRDRNSDYMALLVIGAGPVYRRHCD